MKKAKRITSNAESRLHRETSNLEPRTRLQLAPEEQWKLAGGKRRAQPPDSSSKKRLPRRGNGTFRAAMLTKKPSRLKGREYGNAAHPLTPPAYDFDVRCSMSPDFISIRCFS
jgi:hypothetical protein